jgi:putative ABC transport system permease protein
MTKATQTTRFRVWRWLIALIGVIVPRRLRADWRQEWEAELRYREELLAEWDKLDWRNKLDLLWRSLGAFLDALLLQPRRLEDEMFQDLSFGVRMLLRSPAFTLAAVWSLAIGIGATSAIFSVVNGVVLRPLPYREPEQLVRLWHSKPQIGMTQIPISGGNVQVWRERAQSFAGVAAFNTTQAILTGEAEPEVVQGARVSANLLPLLGYQPQLGRGFLPTENQQPNHAVILLSHKLWQRRFGGDPNVIGRAVTLDHTNSYTVVGVMPPQVSFPGESEFWYPETTTAQGRHDMRSLNVIARLKPGVTWQTAENELQLIHKQLQQQQADDYKDWAVWSQPLHDSVVGKVRPTLLMLLGAVGFVLLIACANVANLLLVRAAARQKEIAVRAALGAGRLRLIRQLLTESSLLAGLGGALGLLLAYGAVRALIVLNPPNVPRLSQINLDGRVLAFTFITTLLVGLLFGLAPALHASKPDVNQALKEGFVQSSGRRWLSVFGLRGFGLREALVVVQTALALVLLVGAGLLIKSFVKLQQVELGFEPHNAIVLTLTPPFNQLPKRASAIPYYQRLIDELKTVPGVSAVALGTAAPTQGAYMSSAMIVAGRPLPAERDAQQTFVNVVSSDYFRALGNSLKQGRLFTDAENESTPLVAVINETLSRAYFPNENPLGQRIALRGDPDELREIVGIVADINQFGLDKEHKPTFYVPFRQQDAVAMNLVVRTAADPAALLPALRARILAADKFTAITRVRTLEDLVSASVAQPRFYALLLALFAAIALTLAVVGIYGVMAYAVSRRTHEIGIRMALGAEAGRIQRLIVGQGMLLIGMGIAVGLIAARMLTRVLTDLLFGVKPTDPVTFALIAGVLTGAALLACWIPARRAARVDPLVALRCE